MTEKDSIVATRRVLDEQEAIIVELIGGLDAGMERTWLGVAVQNLKVARRSLARAIREGENS